MLAKKMAGAVSTPCPASKPHTRAQHPTRHPRHYQRYAGASFPSADEVSLCESFTSAMQAHQEAPSHESAATLITAYQRFAERIAPDAAVDMVSELRAKLASQGVA
jgi:hypothetical protein